MAKKYSKNLENFVKNWKRNSDLAFVSKLQKKFPNAEVFLVGGMVRDIALGRDSKDYDLVVRNVLGKKLMEYLASVGDVNLVGKKFGVYKFYPKGKKIERQKNKKKIEAIDIALPRTEKSLGSGKYRDFTIVSDYKLPIEKDLQRRDFTINAMALRLSSGVNAQKLGIVDPFLGLQDIEKKVIRTVGKPKDRFAEDYSRMLRAVRFACQLDFEIDAYTWKAVKSLMPKIVSKSNGVQIVPNEIIAKELVKAFEKNPLWALELFDKCGAIKILIPELLKMKKSPQPEEFHTEGDVWEHTKLVIDNLYSKKFQKEFSIRNPQSAISNELLWAALFHDVGKPYTLTMTDRVRNNGHDTKGAEIFSKVSRRLKLTNAGMDSSVAEKIIARHMIPTQAKQMKETTLEKIFFNAEFPGDELLMLIFADISATIPLSGKPDYSSYRIIKKRVELLRKKTKNKKTLPKELLDGNEIMKILGTTPGSLIGDVKQYLRELQLKGSVRSKNQATVLIRKKYKK